MGNVKCCTKQILQENEIIKGNTPRRSSKSHITNLNIPINNKTPFEEKITDNESINLNLNLNNVIQEKENDKKINLKSQPKNNIIPQIKLNRNAKKIQSIFRGYKIRKNYENKIKPELKETEKNIIKKNLLELSKTNPNINKEQLNISQSSYNSKEWKNYYNNNDSFFNYDYGNTINNQCIIKRTNSNKIELYQGSINLKNEKQGFGILITENKTLTGFWRENNFTGWGKEKNKTGEIYEGKYINGKLNGKGIYKNNNGDFYYGEYINGLKNGKGKEKNSEFEYEGDYKNNKLNGIGKIKFKNKQCEYEGNFENNNLNGFGIFKWENGEVYEGNLNNGIISGRGKYIYPDGEIYEGDYKRGIKQGFGKIKFSNGNSYEGPFNNGLPHGIGKYIKKGKSKNVEFNNGKFIKVIN